MAKYLTGETPFSNRFRKHIPLFSIFLLLVFTNLIVGCHYYRIKSAPPEPNTVKQAVKEEKYIIVHQASHHWHITAVVVDDDKREIRGTIAPLDDGHRHFETAERGKLNRYSKSDGDPDIEVHIFTDVSTVSDSLLILPIDAVNRIDAYDMHSGATIASHVGITIGVIAGVIVIIGLIVFLTKSSCPFVYISDGESYRFVGEMYGGAIYPSLERDDYMPLPGFSATNGEYTLKITNELKEVQYTNLAQLMVVEHSADLEVLIDKHGAVQTLSNPVAPVRVFSGMGVDYTSTLAARDSAVYMFNDNAPDNVNNSSLTLSFARDNKARSGKLVIRAKNSYWLDYIYGEFNELFGSYYDAFAEQQGNVPAEELLQWSRDQEIPLSVYLKTHSGWELIETFDVTGPLASRDMVMPVDLSKAAGDEVQIKLECGFMFWELDYAAMDFSENKSVKVSNLIPSSAVDEKGVDVAGLIAGTDDQYLVQPEITNIAVIRYPANEPQPGNEQTVFLHSRGYYEYIRDYTGFPDLNSLRRFKDKGAFTEFSRERYIEFIKEGDGFFANFIGASHGN